MGEFRSIETSTTFLWSETYANSDIFEQQHFVPSVFEFDIDRDSLRPSNITLVSVGTRIPYIASRNSSTYRRYYVGLNYNSPIRFYWYNHTGLGIYLYYSPGFTTIGWLSSYTYGYWDSDYTNASEGALLGTYYHPDTNSYYLFVATKYLNSDEWNIDGYWLDQDDIRWSDDKKILAKKWIADNFYGAALPESYMITRDEPSSSIFSTGQTSQLLYSLTTKSGIPISADISIVALGIGSSPGWVFDGTVSPPTLTLTSSKYRFSVKVSCEYEGITYELVDTFYPDGYTPYGPGGVSRPGGGNGSFWNPESDRVDQDIPQGSDIGQDSSTGMYTRYLMNSSFLELLGDWVYDPNVGLSLIKEALGYMYGDTGADSLISLLSFPFSLVAPLIGITSKSQPMYFGHQPVSFLGIAPTNYIALTSGSAQIDWGTLILEEYWGNFLDYAPHTKIELYLPWGTGFVSLDPGQCLPGSITVKTNIEFARGSCVHHVINQDGCVIGSYMGQPGSMVPLISSDISAKRAGMMIGAVAAMASGGLALAGTGAGLAMSSATTQESLRTMTQFGPQPKRSTVLANSFRDAPNKLEILTGSPGISKAQSFSTKVASDAAVAAARTPVHMTRNGGFGDASAGTMIQYPYVIISRPEQNVPDSYGQHYGYPSNIYEPLSTLKGYTEIAAIHLNGIGCSASEMSELERILTGGVIF